MSSHARIFTFLLFTLCIAAPHSHGQAVDGGSSFAIWSGANFANGHIFGYAQDRRMVQAAFSWTPALMRRSLITVRYRMDAVPMALLHDRRYAPPGKPDPHGTEWVAGAGMSPVGGQVDFHTRTRFTPFFEVTGGFLYFSRKVLAYNETQFQFTVASGVGARIPLRGRIGVEFGYKYHHMSNANIYRSNPGLDSQIVYTGLCF